MTADQKFLKDNRIEPCESLEPRWMTWRDEEVEALRMSVANWIIEVREITKSREFWKLFAFAGWFASALLFLIPIVERLTK